MHASRLLSCFVGACSLIASATPFLRAQQPPIVDRRAFFGEVQIAGARISPDGTRLTFLKPYKGVRNIWVKKVGEPFSAARPISADTKRPIGGYFWSRDSKYVLYAQDNGGDENYNVYAIDPNAPADAATGVPPARNLTNLKDVRAMIYAAPKSKPDVLYIGLNDRDPRYHDLYELHLSTGEKTLLKKNTDDIAGWVFDNAGNLRLAEKVMPNGDSEILRVDPAGMKVIYTCSVLESCGPSGFTADNKLAYFETNKGDLNLTELDTLDLQTGAIVKVESDPLKRVDFGDMEQSEIDYRILYTTYDDDRERRYFRDKAFEKDFKFLESKLPGMEVHLVSSSADENVYVVSASSDVEPGQTYLWNRKAHTLDFQYKVREDLPREALSPRQPFHYKSSDGLDIPAYVTIPKGLTAKNLPMVVYPHGGPWARDEYGYDPFAQFLANRGYVVLQPNFRASTGYGKQFLNAGNGQWGRLMQDDLTWGVKALVAQGTVDPKRVGIFGISYGGYATLAGVAFTPDLYAAAVAYAAPANLVTLLQTIPPYWEAGRIQMYTRMADPTKTDGKAILVAESPVNSAKKITTPLMVVQGSNDPRVKPAEAQQIVMAVRDNGRPVEYLLAPDEGHGFARPINTLAQVTAMEQFFAKYLRGRVEGDVPADIAAQLKLLRVDVSTVKVAAPPAPVKLPIGGTWNGGLQMGANTLHLVLHLAPATDGSMGCTMDAVEQKASGIPCGDVAANDRTVTFAVPDIGGNWSGMLSADGKTLSGNFSQGGHQLPLVFEKQN